MYKIVCDDLDVSFNYVGSTKKIIKRKIRHKSDSKNEKYRHMKLYKIINDNGGWDNFSMVKIESCICETTLDARIRERYWYEKLNATMNSNRPIRTSEEVKQESCVRSKQYNINNKAEIKEKTNQYRNDNKEAIQEYQKQYKIDNKETIASSKSELIICEACNCYNSRNHISRHNNSQTHQNNINKLQSTP